MPNQLIISHILICSTDEYKYSGKSVLGDYFRETPTANSSESVQSATDAAVLSTALLAPNLSEPSTLGMCAIDYVFLPSITHIRVQTLPGTVNCDLVVYQSEGMPLSD